MTPRPPRALPHDRSAVRRPVPTGSQGTSTLDPVMEKRRALGLEYPAQALVQDHPFLRTSDHPDLRT